MDRSANTDVAIARICAKHLVITPQAAAEEGIDRRALLRRCRNGQLKQILRGVYHPASTPRSLELRVAAAAAWAPDAVFCDRTGLWLLGLGAAPDILDMATETGRGSPVPWLRFRRVEGFADVDVREIGGFLVTSAYRTLMDAGLYMSRRELEDLLDEAWRQGSVTPSRLELHCTRTGKTRRGTADLLAMVRERKDQAPTASVLEDRAVRLIRRAKIKQPLRQVAVRDLDGKRIARMDLVYPEERLIVECDSLRRHRDNTVFNGDRSKWGRAQSAGYRIQWATWENTAGRGRAFLDELRSNLAELSTKVPGNGTLLDS